MSLFLEATHAVTVSSVVVVVRVAVATVEVHVVSVVTAISRATPVVPVRTLVVQRTIVIVMVASSCKAQPSSDWRTPPRKKKPNFTTQQRMFW